MPIKEYGTRTFLEDSLSFPPTSGKGIKFGAFDQGDNARFGWRDITGSIDVRGTGSTDPDWTQLGSGPFSAYKFAINDQCWLCYHIPHDILPSSDIFLHAHWTTSGTQTAAVKWTFKWMYALGFDQGTFDVNGTAISVSEAASGTAWRHMVTESAAITIPTLTEPDGLLYVNVQRVSNAASPLVENTNNVFLLTADVHYQTTNVATKQRAPNFYAE